MGGAHITTTTTYVYSGTRLNALDTARSDGTTYSIDYLYGDDGAVFAGAYRGSDATAGMAPAGKGIRRYSRDWR